MGRAARLPRLIWWEPHDRKRLAARCDRVRPRVELGLGGSRRRNRHARGRGAGRISPSHDREHREADDDGRAQRHGEVPDERAATGVDGALLRPPDDRTCGRWIDPQRHISAERTLALLSARAFRLRVGAAQFRLRAIRACRMRRGSCRWRRRRYDERLARRHPLRRRRVARGGVRPRRAGSRVPARRRRPWSGDPVEELLDRCRPRRWSRDGRWRRGGEITGPRVPTRTEHGRFAEPWIGSVGQRARRLRIGVVGPVGHDFALPGCEGADGVTR